MQTDSLVVPLFSRRRGTPLRYSLKLIRANDNRCKVMRCNSKINCSKQFFRHVISLAPTVTHFWRQIWRVVGRESGYPELLASPRTSPEVPQTSPEVFWRLPRKFSHCGTLQHPGVPRKFPRLPRTFPGSFFPDFPGKPDTLSRLAQTFPDIWRCCFSDCEELWWINSQLLTFAKGPFCEPPFSCFRELRSKRSPKAPRTPKTFFGHQG